MLLKEKLDSMPNQFESATPPWVVKIMHGATNDLLHATLEAMTYLPGLVETTRMAKEKWINSAPTFIIEGYGTITGAQPIEVFRAALEEVQKEFEQTGSR